ncbi:MAG TPA: hypothetical protein VLA17_10435 [Candidatus Limnocylindria bacterium]|nr:hypothetical protein [Candidatus Limnocylindria bacterium]
MVARKVKTANGFSKFNGSMNPLNVIGFFSMLAASRKDIECVLVEIISPLTAHFAMIAGIGTVRIVKIVPQQNSLQIFGSATVAGN